MRAGRLRHRVTFQYHAEVVGSGGERTKTWGDLATVWASVDPMTSRELNTNSQIQQNTTHKITVRYNPPHYAKSGDTRVLFGNRVFHVIGAMSKMERGIETELMCEEVAGVTV